MKVPETMDEVIERAPCPIFAIQLLIGLGGTPGDKCPVCGEDHSRPRP